MTCIKIEDQHSGKHQDGMLVILVQVDHARHGIFTSCVRALGEECRGMFGPHEGPMQVMKGARFTTSNLGSITEQERQALLRCETVMRPDCSIRMMD